MYGAIVGDIAGSQFERHNILTTSFELFDEFSHFTDDTVLTVATADAMLNGKGFAQAYRQWGNKYEGRGYGSGFRRWLGNPDAGPYNSAANGAAMRVSPIPYLMRDASEEEMLAMVKASAEVTHDSEAGIFWAQELALAIWRFLRGLPDFSQDLKPVDALRGKLRGCMAHDTVPAAMSAVAEADDFEQAIRLAISIGGDSDTIASMAGAMAEARFGLPRSFRKEARIRLPKEMKLLLDELYRAK